MAAATMANNALALVFTVLFARLLGATDYGSLAALVSTFVILSVPGSAVQVAVAREIALGRLGEGPRLAATLSTWRRRLRGRRRGAHRVRRAAAPADRGPDLRAGGVGRGRRGPDRRACGCCSRSSAARSRARTCTSRSAWSIVLEAVGRLVFGLALVAARVGRDGRVPRDAAVAGRDGVRALVDLARAAGRARAGRAARRLRDLVGGAWPAVLGLFLVALLQNVDVILVKRQIGGDAAGAYAAAAVAAKAVVWVAIGIGLYLLPEATRAARHGRDPRPVLARALAVVAAVAVPMLIVYGLFPRPCCGWRSGRRRSSPSDALFVLACAMTLLAVGYLGVQYMLALGRVAFLPALAVVAVAELALLSTIGSKSLVVFAACVLALQAAAALSVLAIGLAPGRRGAAAPAAALAAARRRGLADRRPGRAAVRPRARARAGGAVVEIGSFRGRSTVVLARRRRLGGRDRPARGQRPRAAGDRGRGVARRRRPRGVPGEPGARPASPTACATCASSRRTRTATWPGRCRCCTWTARTASARRGRTSPAGAGGCARAGRCSSTTRSPRSA